METEEATEEEGREKEFGVKGEGEDSEEGKDKDIKQKQKCDMLHYIGLMIRKKKKQERRTKEIMSGGDKEKNEDVK